MGFLDRQRKKDFVKELNGLSSGDAEELYARVEVPGQNTTGPSNAQSYLEQLSNDEPVFLKPKVSKNAFPVQQYLNFRLKALWGGAYDSKDPSPLPVYVPQPSPTEVDKVMVMLKESRRPVLLLGSGVMLGGGLERAQKLKAVIIETLKIPSFLGGMARGLLGRNSPYHIRQNRKDALKKADLVIMFGMVADFRLDYGRSLSHKSKIVTVNRDSSMLTLNTGMVGFWNPTLASKTDPALFLLMLADRAAGSKGYDGERFADWCKSLKAAEKSKEASNLLKAKEKALGHGVKAGQSLVNPLALLHSVDNVLPDDSILVADGGDFVATASYVVRPRGPLSWLDPGAFGTLGVGAGFALGAKLVRPTAEVWLIWGDGSAGYSIAEFDTFIRHNVPVIGLIGNDACWTQIQREQIPMFNDDVACPLDYCAYGTVSKGYGAEGVEITCTDQVEEGLRTARAMVAAGKPVVVNVHIGQTDFREGSLSV